MLLPMTLLFGAEQFLPSVPPPASHDFGAFLDSHAGHALLAGGVLWPAIVLVLMVLNTVLGEELLFRGLLLPRMSGAFGRWDWVANGVLFATLPPAPAVDDPRCSPRRHVRAGLPGTPLPQRRAEHHRPLHADVFFAVALVVVVLG